ncbi:hypothetical protein, partial [Burkholderia oklahomensis]|uniref:hypothetical protein n=1 Tax=Burkholderia oklahomensis TaxID=342113 RepID=UPI001E395ABD
MALVDAIFYLLQDKSNLYRVKLPRRRQLRRVSASSPPLAAQGWRRRLREGAISAMPDGAPAMGAPFFYLPAI